MTLTTAAVVRLALIGLLGGILQATALSQLTVFGVAIDLSPLIVASIGFIAGSVPGAVFGFFFGLLIDSTLFAKLGVSSLVFTAVGYGAGRIRELRDPAHGLAPVADRRGGDGGRGRRLHAAAVPRRRHGAGLPAAAAHYVDDDRGQHAARPARLRGAAPPAREVPAR